MYQIQAITAFSAAHQLVGYDGNCSNPHGHNWRVKACLETEGLDEVGIAVDFRRLKQSLNALLAEMDHSDLNAHPAFRRQNPTSEVIAKYIFQQLKSEFPGPDIRVVQVEVAENNDCCAVYYE